MSSDTRRCVPQPWRAAAAVGTVVFVMVVVLMQIRRAVPSRPAAESTSAITVVSLNVAHGRSNTVHQALLSPASIRANLQEVAACLTRERPHVVALQEADGPSAWSGSFDHVQFLADATGIEHAFRGEHVAMLKLSYGTALLSARPLVEAESHTFAASFPTPSKGIVWCRIKWPEKPECEVCVASIHLDFARASVRQSQADEICQLLNQMDCPLILMGDFNCEWNTPEGTLRRITERLSLRPFAPATADQTTFPATGQRLDWILISPELQFESCVVLQDTVSDHQPVAARIRLTPSQ